MKKTLLILALAMVLPTLASSAAMAAGGKIRFGNLAVVPMMGVTEMFSDNIYYEKKGKQSDWITHVRPGLMLDYTIEGRGKFVFGYKGDYAYYKSKNDNDWKRHDLVLGLDYLSPGGLIVKIKNDVRHVSDPFGDEFDYETGVQSKRWEEDLETAVGYKFSDRFKLLTYYNYHRLDYKNTAEQRYTNSSFYPPAGSGSDYPDYYYTGSGDFRQDYYTNEAGLGFETKVTHKTWAFLRYHNGSQQYFTHRNGITSSNDASYDWQRVNTGLGWDDGARFGGELNVGYQWNSYQNSHDQFGNRYKNKNSWIADTRVTFRQVEGRTFYAAAMRRQQQLDGGSIGYYTNNIFGLGVEQKIKSKFFLSLGYFFEKNKFSSQGSTGYYSFSSHRNDTVNSVRTGLKYTITEWLTAGAEYNYMHNHSTDTFGGFVNNRFALSLDFLPAGYH